ncbi:PEGA domain-containing protein, partial [Candidatus Poribacteria bacterium]|nr:PEGA domain-containing protein [Candidatus Poribacteria bacterium]
MIFNNKFEVFTGLKNPFTPLLRGEWTSPIRKKLYIFESYQTLKIIFYRENKMNKNERNLQAFPPHLFKILLIIPLFIIFSLSLAQGANISGKVQIEGRTDLSGVLITVQGVSLSGITKEDGTYYIQDVPSGSFTLVAQKPGCIVEVQDITVGIDNTQADFNLIPGDLKIDNQINLLDRLMLSRAWGAQSGDANWDDMLDIYEDDVIDNNDLDLLISHWKKGNSNIQLGALMVASEPSGASILINGADTGKTTPHSFTGIVTGQYVITLMVENYAPGVAEAQILDGETTQIDMILDDQPPEFANWELDPANLTEDTQGRLRISIQVIDQGGSGLSNNPPQFDYHVGSDTKYNGYENMTKESGDTWYFEIPEPVQSWNALRGEMVFFKAKADDAAGNEAESQEQTEIIDDINDKPIVNLTSAINPWERGLIIIQAEADDSDGNITSVKFEYSLDNSLWQQIGNIDTTSPYSVPWDTTSTIPAVDDSVWVRAIATDNGGLTDLDVIADSFRIDNQPPSTTHDYDGQWKNENFTINLSADDGSGVGLAKIAYVLNSGNIQEFEINGQRSISVNIISDSSTNSIEYWSIDALGNEESHQTLSNIKLDKTPPVFANW